MQTIGPWQKLSDVAPLEVYAQQAMNTQAKGRSCTGEPE
jgi:hypothetical protein